MSCSVCLSVCLFDCLSDYLPDRPSACLSICLPPAAAFHPYCPQWFGNNFRRKYTQSRVICQSVVMKVARHVCKSGLSVPVVGFMCADPALLPTSSLYFIVTGADYGFLPPSFFMDVVPNCGKGPLSSGCFAIRRGPCRCPAYPS